ncbi:acyl-CoA dehydrogenase family protein [Micromonospora sp. NPDC049044]|uniref:acyl-CoA dehydrogenase family protein n=1 Tax=unclassified Micromonospora TaxID=2617518 RepID=UPI0033D38E2D
MDDRLYALRREVYGWARELRRHSLDVDADPARVHELLAQPGVAYMETLGIPPEFGGPVLRVGGYRYDGMSAIERVVSLEELAFGDAGILLAAPGPSMFGVLLCQLGNEKQKTTYFDRLLERPTWTFFGLTEPDRGSDATAITTALTPVPEQSGFLLDGAKRYIGNGSRATFGAVFCRTGPGPFGVSAAIVEADSPGFTAEPLDMIGLRAVQISHLQLKAVPVPVEGLLGAHLPTTRRGMWGFLQVFNRLRPTVAAMAVGVARAALEYAGTERRLAPPAVQEELAVLGSRIDLSRALVHRAARAVDAHGDGQPASVAKVSACRLAASVTLRAAALLGPAARIEHPLLDKFVRDAQGLEFMEGTSNIQRLNVIPGLLGHDLR